MPALFCCSRHCARNCGHVSPFVVPAALACLHWSPQTFMTLCALAADEPARMKPMISPAVDASRSDE
jgi:hypothetical protein